MVSSIPSIANIGALLGLIFFIYAIVGRQLYSFLPDTDGGVGHTANFRSFRNAILLLLRFSTGEAWNGFMHSIHGTSDSGCDPDPTFNPDAPWCLTTEDLPNCTVLNGCPGGTFATYAYFYSFTLLVSYVVLNLFVAVVLEAFDNSKESDILSADDLESFTRLWAEYDEDATWYIEAAKVKELISRLGPPLGFGFGANEDVHDARDIESLMQESGLADIPVNRDGKCNIVPVATLLGKSKSSQVEPVFERTHCQTFWHTLSFLYSIAPFSSTAKRLAQAKQGNDFHELSSDNPLQQELSLLGQNARALRETVYFGTLQHAKLRALRTFVRTYKHRHQTTQNVKSSRVVPVTCTSEAEHDGG